MTAAEWVRVLTAPFLPLALFAAVLHGGHRLSLWPAPRPALDIDRTILIHQIEASRRTDPVEVILIGDSSCLMDVDALRLARVSGMSCLNLATISYLDLDHHRRLAESYLRSNPGHPRIVILLMHPESLRRAGADDVVARFFDSYLAGEPVPWRHTFLDRLEGWLGLDLWRDRFLARAVPNPLPGAFGTRYGFTSQLEDYLTQHRGSLVDPTRSEPSGNPEYSLHPALEAKSMRLRRALPDRVKLVVGITPVPEGFPHADYEAVRRTMLAQWSAWSGADAVPRDLPPTLPAAWFATTTHLNETGTRQFTDRLGAWLRDQSF